MTHHMGGSSLPLLHQGMGFQVCGNATQLDARMVACTKHYTLTVLEGRGAFCDGERCIS